MASLLESKRSQNKQCTVKVRSGIFIESLSYFVIPKSCLPIQKRYSHSNSHMFAMTLIAQDVHLTAGAWAACDCTRFFMQEEQLPEAKNNTLLLSW